MCKLHPGYRKACPSLVTLVFKKYTSFSDFHKSINAMGLVESDTLIASC